MRDKKVAVRYAVALLGAVKKTAELEAVSKDLNGFAALYRENGELRAILNHPGIPLARKMAILAGVGKKAGMSAIALKALEVVLRRGRVNVAGDIAESFGEMIDEKLGRQSVKVTSAYKLAAEDVAALEKVFSAATGRVAKVETVVDPSLIGGLVARAGSKVYDGSVRNQLAAMKLKLEQEA